jgi:hypothetical protein
MGGHPWMYFVRSQPSVDAALQSLKQREFAAGRYNPVTPFLPFPIDDTAPAPGAGHDSIEAARLDADADGTRSILDMESIGEEPALGVITRIPDEELVDIYGTARPSRQVVQDDPAFLDEIARGMGVYFFTGDEPACICFAGYSFD